jgi:hypothetical protein
MGHRASQKDFVFFPGDLRAWANLSDVELVALHSWSASRLKIASLDQEKRIVTFTSAPTFRIGYWYPDARNPYYVENVKEELRKPGEWYLDRSSGRLTYLPLPGETLQNTTIFAPHLERLLIIAGDQSDPGRLAHVTISNLAFAHTEWPLPTTGYDTFQGQPTLSSAIEVTASAGVRIERCIISNTGAYGIALGLGTQNCKVVGCLMYDLGGGGVKIGDIRMSLTASPPMLPTGNVVAQNTITDIGQVHYSSNGIWAGIVKDTRIINNEIRRAPYTGIAVGWSWNDRPTSCGGNVIERNHIHHVMQLLQDGGGIYTLGRQPGTVIRGNLIHHSSPSHLASGPGTAGLYFDQGSSGFLVEDNVQYDIHFHGDRIHQDLSTAKTHIIRNNHLGTRPGTKGFPQALASRTGVHPSFTWPLASRLTSTKNPLHSMQLEKPPTSPSSLGFAFDFENLPEGRIPSKFGWSGFTKTASIGASRDCARSGLQSLKFQDRKGLSRHFDPHISYRMLDISTGHIELSFALRQDPTSPAAIWVELRDYATKGAANYFSGPSVAILPDGRVTLGKQTLTKIPLGDWAHISLRFTVGPGSPKLYETIVRLGDGTTKTIRAPFLDFRFKRVTTLIVTTSADADGVAYVDDLRLVVGKEKK